MSSRLHAVYVRAPRAALVFAVIILSACLDAQKQASPEPGARATNFSLSKTGDWSMVSVSNPWNGASGTQRYCLYPRSGKSPSGAELEKAGFDRDCVPIPVPVRRAVALSSTYVAALEKLDALDCLVAIDSAEWLCSARTRELVESGKVREVMKAQSPDVEALISLKPDVIFVYGVGNKYDSYPQLSKLRLPVVLCADWTETHPLGRMDWLRFFAAFTGTESRADRLVREASKNYAAIRESAKVVASAAGNRVLVNAPYQGVWHVSGGKSSIATLVADAGGSYLWADDESATGTDISIEAAFSRAARADVWINPGMARNRHDLLSMDKRLVSLPVLKTGRIWTGTKAVLPSGGNDLYERGPWEPDRLLAEYALMINPGTRLPAGISSAFVYFSQLE